MELDSTDQGLLNLLRVNARTPVVELAKHLAVSRATVQNRLKRLEERKVIRGYTVVVADEIEKPEVRALMSIEAQSAKERSVINRLRGNPNVVAIHHTNGQWDLIAEIHADSLSSFNKVVGAIRLIEGYRRNRN